LALGGMASLQTGGSNPRISPPVGIAAHG